VIAAEAFRRGWALLPLAVACSVGSEAQRSIPAMASASTNGPDSGTAGAPATRPVSPVSAGPRSGPDASSTVNVEQRDAGPTISMGGSDASSPADPGTMEVSKFECAEFAEGALTGLGARCWRTVAFNQAGTLEVCFENPDEGRFRVIGCSERDDCLPGESRERLTRLCCAGLPLTGFSFNPYCVSAGGYSTVVTALDPGGFPDSDTDFIPNIVDNCPGFSNFGQIDGDQDGVGDDCEPTPAESVASARFGCDSLAIAGPNVQCSPVREGSASGEVCFDNAGNAADFFVIGCTAETPCRALEARVEGENLCCHAVARSGTEVNPYCVETDERSDILMAGSGFVDTDGDFAPDLADNCSGLRNFNQLDSDQDGVGDECEVPAADAGAPGPFGM
jgi:hypothetical protein